MTTGKPSLPPGYVRIDNGQVYNLRLVYKWEPVGSAVRVFFVPSDVKISKVLPISEADFITQLWFMHGGSE